MAEEKQELRYLVRIADTDIDGRKHTAVALTKIKGISTMVAHAVCKVCAIPSGKKAGELSDAETKKLQEAVKNPVKAGVPQWMLNRRFDPETGEHHHVIGTDLIVAKETDLKRMKKMKSYRGVRHMHGLPVRGQRTRSNFRPNKGKVKLGVTTSGKKKTGTT